MLPPSFHAIPIKVIIELFNLQLLRLNKLTFISPDFSFLLSCNLPFPSTLKKKKSLLQKSLVKGIYDPSFQDGHLPGTI